MIKGSGCVCILYRRNIDIVTEDSTVCWLLKSSDPSSPVPSPKPRGCYGSNFWAPYKTYWSVLGMSHGVPVCWNLPDTLVITCWMANCISSLPHSLFYTTCAEPLASGKFLHPRQSSKTTKRSGGQK